ncbi:hypothetical protein [Algoriphagus sp. NG3]|uniref:hypothetical protein n=1 Tax=Algoriphagus sp. NG3 TaxID=3097546 RepID=UPI002A82CCE1|nr:hypothetical protein [Algoriphagus sp. NG3]WPR77744.1 hypothetical protein SLW71_10350 [Algoriphagus sp. NG3]
MKSSITKNVTHWDDYNACEIPSDPLKTKNKQMKWLFKERVKSQSWEEGFLGRRGTVVTKITNEKHGNGLITIERDSQLFHFYAITDDGILEPGVDVVVVGIVKNVFKVSGHQKS